MQPLWTSRWMWLRIFVSMKAKIKSFDLAEIKELVERLASMENRHDKVNTSREPCPTLWLEYEPTFL